jgi:osmotically-inducible protein OsmY
MFFVLLVLTACAWAALTDAQIERALKARLGRSKLAADKLEFAVHGGVVEWNGTVRVPQRKGAATRMAKSAGAAKVVNRIKIAAPVTLPRQVQVFVPRR